MTQLIFAALSLALLTVPPGDPLVVGPDAVASRLRIDPEVLARSVGELDEAGVAVALHVALVRGGAAAEGTCVTAFWDADALRACADESGVARVRLDELRASSLCLRVPSGVDISLSVPALDYLPEADDLRTALSDIGADDGEPGECRS